MLPKEPLPTAWMLAIFGALVGVSAVLSRLFGRVGLPAFTLFLGLGMLAGEEGLGGLRFADYELAFRIGTIALTLILFDGGLNTSYATIRRHVAPAGVLATVGVVATAALVAIAARAFGFLWPHALLLGTVVSSTDAAAVFSVLRSAGLSVKKRVGATLEIESGTNDPAAVILTIELVRRLLVGGDPAHLVLWRLVGQLLFGLVLGAAIGYLGRSLLRLRPLAGGLFPVLTAATASLAFGVTTIVQGSGLFAVYVAGIVVGNGPLPYRSGILRVHDFLAWASQVVMFVMLGLLVLPSQLSEVAAPGLAVAAFLAVVARPLVVLACLAPFRYPPREILYIGWVGLRGAVPIILAAYPVLAGIPGAIDVFNAVFFVVFVSATLQGGTVRWITRRLGLEARTPPPPPVVVEITSPKMLRGEVLGFPIDRRSAACGARIADLPFPEESSALLVVRGDELVAARGNTRLEEGDHVYVFARPEDRPLLYLIFGEPEQE